MKKKILLITFRFPPEQNPRAFRWGSIVKALSNAGYEIDVLMPRHKDIVRRSQMGNVRYYETKRYLLYDFAYKYILRGSSENINQKVKGHVLNLKKIIKNIFSFLAKKLIWPDLTGLWFFPAQKKLKELFQNNKYDCIISSSVPFVVHLVGYYAKRRLKDVSWIGEYGDPFSFNAESPQNIFNFLNKLVEKKITKKMDYIVVPVEKSKIGFLKQFPLLEENKIKVIPQLLDYVPVNPDNIDWSLFDGELINIVYTGTLYPDIRNPKILLESLLRLKTTDINGYKRLRFHFFGEYENVGKIFREHKELLNDKTLILYGQVLREVCSFACQKADFLLNISNFSDYQTPSKLIEYLSYKKPIISLENKKSTELNWSFLIKVDYKIDVVVNFLKRLSGGAVNVSFRDYNNIVKKYNISKITEQYINLIYPKV